MAGSQATTDAGRADGARRGGRKRQSSCAADESAARVKHGARGNEGPLAAAGNMDALLALAVGLPPLPGPESGKVACPICQAPSVAQGHVAQCLQREQPDAECLTGAACRVADVFHYRRYAHAGVAALRTAAALVPGGGDVVMDSSGSESGDESSFVFDLCAIEEERTLQAGGDAAAAWADEGAPMSSPSSEQSTPTPQRALRQLDIGVFLGIPALVHRASSAVRSVARRWYYGARSSQNGASVAMDAPDIRDIGAASWDAEDAREDAAAADANGVEAATARNGAKRPRRCPFYKRIEGTSFSVDAFGYGKVPACLHYFLTHFHSDHYGGLGKGWDHGPIYCSRVTANLVISQLGVSAALVRVLPTDGSATTIDGARVTLLDANHCPGAVCFLFELPDGRRVLHTGDFRAYPDLARHPALRGPRQPPRAGRCIVDDLYLDTTYCNPNYDFPAQADVVDFIVRVAQAEVARRPRALIAVGTYTIGKERVAKALARAFNAPIYASQQKLQLLEHLEDDALRGAAVTSEGTSTRIHILNLFDCALERMAAYVDAFRPTYDCAIVFRPTGWTAGASSGGQQMLESIRPKAFGSVTVYNVPYSEHSSYAELREFVRAVRPRKILPTVNVGRREQRDAMYRMFAEWLATPATPTTGA